jgi:hypothetical protein
MSRRLRLSAIVACAVALGVAAPSARADTLDQVRAVDAQISTVSAQEHEAHAGLVRISRAITNDTDAVERLQQQQPVGVGFQRVRRQLSTAQARLARAVAKAKQDDFVGQVAALQDQLDGLAAQRSALVAADPLLQEGSASVVSSPPGSSIQRGAWAVALLEALQAPACQSNLTSLVAWQTAENTTAGWNPLATTLPASGATQYNSAGVRNYSSLEDGIQATVDTLDQGYYTQGYGWIEYRLRTCATPIVTVKAINASNWCHGCAGGRYVTDVLGAVEENYPVFAGS